MYVRGLMETVADASLVRRWVAALTLAVLGCMLGLYGECDDVRTKSSPAYRVTCSVTLLLLLLLLLMLMVWCFLRTATGLDAGKNDAKIYLSRVPPHSLTYICKGNHVYMYLPLRGSPRYWPVYQLSRGHPLAKIERTFQADRFLALLDGLT
jgi:hypothetical protein